MSLPVYVTVTVFIYLCKFVILVVLLNYQDCKHDTLFDFTMCKVTGHTRFLFFESAKQTLFVFKRNYCVIWLFDV